MKINFTDTYRLWHLLATISVIGVLIVFFIGFDQIQNVWKSSYHDIYILFIGVLLASVLNRMYMGLSGTNSIPIVHIFRAKNISDAAIAILIISICAVLLITLISEIYFLVTIKEQHALWVYSLRNSIQPVFAILVTLHVLYVLINKRDTLSKLVNASDN